MKTTITELIPSFSTKSFYNKACIIDTGKAKFLRSYDSIVASVDAKGKIHRHYDEKTRTTTRHVLSFIHQFAKNIITSKEFWLLPVETYKPIKVEF